MPRRPPCALGQQPDEPRGQVPVLDRGETDRVGVDRCGRRPARRAYSPTPTADRVGGEHEPDDPAARRRRPAPPTASSMRGRRTWRPRPRRSGPGPCLEGAGQPVHLATGALVERRGPADGPVAALEVGEQSSGGGAAPADLGVERPSPSGWTGVPCAMTSTPTGVAAGPDRCTRSRGRPPPARPSAWTSVHHALEDVGIGLGQHPVAQVEDVPGAASRPPGARRGSRPRRRPTAPGRWPGRGCPARRGRGRPAGGPRRAAPASPRRPPRRRAGHQSRAARRSRRRSGCGARPRSARPARDTLRVAGRTWRS